MNIDEFQKKGQKCHEMANMIHQDLANAPSSEKVTIALEVLVLALLDHKPDLIGQLAAAATAFDMLPILLVAEGRARARKAKR